jgi:hypothetical protein
MVGGPGFEPGGSRSRTLRPFVQKCRKRIDFGSSLLAQKAAPFRFEPFFLPISARTTAQRRRRRCVQPIALATWAQVAVAGSAGECVSGATG